MDIDFQYVTQDAREQLYQEVWDEPVKEVAIKYAISDTALRKHLKRLMIPLPPRGYWLRKDRGEKVNKVELPPVRGALKKHVRNYVIKFRKDIDCISDGELNSKEELNLLRNETKEFIREKCSNMKVNSQLRSPHRLISEHKEEMNYRNKRKRELKKSYNKALETKDDDNNAALPIQVSSSNINRAYRILDLIIKTLEEMEGHTRVERRDNKDTARFSVMYADFYFEMREKSNQLILRLSAEDWLSFNSKNGEILEFKDQKDLPLEKQVGKIVYDMFVTVNRFFANYTFEKRLEERKREEQDRQRRLEQMRSGELEEIKQLTQAVSDWDKAKKIREFADDMETRVQEITDKNRKGQLLNWMKWARDKADWIDPLLEKDDELLGKNECILDIILKNKKS